MLKDAGLKARALLGGWNSWVSGGGTVASGIR
jgi:hypothetical protein